MFLNFLKLPGINLHMQFLRLRLVIGKFEGKKIERKNIRKMYKNFLLFGCSWKSWGKED